MRRASGPDPQDRGGGHQALLGAYALWTVHIGRSVRSFPSGGMKGMTKPDTPFPKHWLYYIVLKYVVIAAAVLIAKGCASAEPSVTAN
jgi:hypothetical protein